MKTIPARIREKRLAPSIQEFGLVYKSGIADVQSYQLDKFNRLWTNIQRNIPYYQELVQSGFVPTEVRNWHDFAKFPIQTRASIQEDVTRFIDHSQEIAGWSVTGGSTGTPIRVPYCMSNTKAPMFSAWLGREFYDIQVSDRMFHFWGHAHLFGLSLIHI